MALQPDIQYVPICYVDGSTARKLDQPLECVFKTLVTRGEKKGLQVFCIPVDATLDLKKAARVSRDKKIEMIAQGRLNKYYKEVCLLNQAYIDDNKLTVAQYLQNADKELTVTDFKRYTLRAE